MSPKLMFSLNSLVDRRKPQDNREDELAIVKAAAWAWYQHGSGSEGKKAISEFGVTARTQRAARPSRFKLEAMRMAKEAKEGTPLHTNKNKSLFDTYEVQSISRQLDRLIIESSHHNKLVNVSGNNTSAKNDGNRRMKKKRNVIKGFWPRNAVVCGGGNDVVDGNVVKRVPVVNLAKVSSKVQ